MVAAPPRAFRDEPEDLPAPPGAPPRRPFRWGVLALGLSAAAVTTSVLVTSMLEVRPADSASLFADRFVNGIKLGEEREAGPDGEELTGYAHAYGMFAEDLKERIPWIDFYQAWICLTRQHGPVMASMEDRSRWSVSRTHRSRRRFVYRILLGPPGRAHEDMTPFALHLGFARQGDGFVVRDYELEPLDGER